MENGDSEWTLDLLERIATEVKAGNVANLLNRPDRVVFNDSPQAHAYGNHNTYHYTSDRERKLADDRIEHLEEEVKYLRELGKGK